jgi:hypothetical protein
MKKTITSSINSFIGKFWLSALVLCGLAGTVNSQTTYSFTTAGAIGRFGPTQAQVNTAYLATNLNGSVVVTNGGIQNFTVPVTGLYQIRAYGAQGGAFCGNAGGLGAYIQGDVNLVAGNVLQIMVGQQGIGSGMAGGGGGGSGVYMGITPIAAAGGGGGSSGANCEAGKPGLITINGGNSSGPGGIGGLGGGKGYVNGDCGWGSGGGGWSGTGYGGNGTWDGGTPGVIGGPGSGLSAQAFGTGGLNGGCGFNVNMGSGGYGFGGGGHGEYGGGGGGGYSGGGGGQYVSPSGSRSGGGGGSFNSGINQVNTQGVNAGDGKLYLILLCNPGALPTNTTPVLNQNICANNNTTLNAIGSGTINWYPNPTATVSLGTGTAYVTPTLAAGVYTYYAAATNTCGEGPRLPVTVTVNVANVTITSPALAICAGSTVTLTANGALSYTWSNGALTSTIAVSPLVNTSYSVIGLTAGGCTATAIQVVTVNPAPTVPNPVTASPSTFCAVGGTTNLNAVSAGNSINWYTVPVGGTPIGSSASGANFSVTALTTTTYYAEAFTIAQATLNYTGGVQTYTVPSGISVMTVDVIGAKGGTGWQNYSTGGNGGRVTGTIAVVGGQVLNIYVGGAGTNASAGVAGIGGFNGGGNGGAYPGLYGGGGGGGASDIRVSPYGLANRLAVAGGGGGGGFDYSISQWERGGMGGGLNGEGGYHGNVLLQSGYPGSGGTQGAGGAAGFFSGYCGAFAGVLGNGGNGGPCTNSGGGGGGGYYGGGGGVWSGGGGGSNYLPNGTHTQGFQSGNGQVILTGVGCVSPSRGMVVVNVNPSPTVTITGPTQICIGGTVNLTANGALTYSWSTGALTQNIATTPTINTTYTVIGTNTITGCAASATQAVAVNALPVVSIAGNNTLCAGTSLTLTASGGNTYTWNPGGAVNPLVVSPTVNVVYTVTGTNTLTACSNTAAQSVTVNAVPNVTVTGPYAMCLTQTVNFAAYGAPSYSWSTGATGSVIAISPTVNTTYTVYGTSPLGCGSSAVVKSITVNPIPVVTVVANSTLICKGERITLTAGGVDTYSWNTGALTPTISVSPTINTTYTVTGTNTTTGCYNDTTITIFVSPCTGIELLSALPGAEIKVYPNPNNGEFVVELNNGLDKTIEVYDLMGRSILNKSGEEDKIFVNISTLSNGIYYVKIQSDNSVKVVKIVKQ